MSCSLASCSVERSTTRSLADTMPAVTLWLKPKGLPIATTGSPTRTASESPSGRIGSGAGGSTLSSATSVGASAPTTHAGSSRPSYRRTRRSTTLRTTCSFVTMKPALWMMKPVPIEVLPDSSGDALASSTTPRTCTTAGRARSARSARLGPPALALWRGWLVHSASCSARAGACIIVPTVKAAATRRSGGGRRMTPPKLTPSPRLLQARVALDPAQQAAELALLVRREVVLRDARVARCEGQLGLLVALVAMVGLVAFVADAPPHVVDERLGHLLRAVDQLLRLLGLADGVQVLEQRVRAERDGRPQPGEQDERRQAHAELQQPEHGFS